ncbi:dynamin family protein [Nocardia bovistercoris]|uniref:Dynamin family protein n=1 Tax=Nocardia bovistercoris TaxID=2785916 RepID=A0A931N2Y8_9NOCA|nr:dynamin family protein [Nocardia bovistercoris]MBH0777202.1 dynamin family protein [Nocardia bovistercoris]
MSAAAGVESVTVKHPDAMAPLIGILDELREMTGAAGRDDLTGRLTMVKARVGDPRVRLVVIGEPKNGMSTLVNGLVGAQVSATDSPVSVPVIVEYGPRSTATLVKAVGGGRTERQPVDPLDPGPALRAEGVIRVEFTEPSPLLADGIVVMDAPGAAADEHVKWSMIAAADAVLYVVDAHAELTRDQIAHLERVRNLCPTVICVLNKIDLFPHWAHVQQRDRELLDAAGLGFAVAPVSALLHRRAAGNQVAGGYQRDIESGMPQLMDHLRDYVVARADSVAIEAAVRDIRLVSDHLAVTLHGEAEALRDPRRKAQITQQFAAARDQAEQLRQRTANWQVTLVDGSTELMADIEHDLRHRLRSLVRDAEAEITQTDPARGWKEFGADLDARICEAVEENFVMAHYRSVELCDQVASKFPADNRTPPLPDLRLENPGDVLEPVAPLEPLDSAKAGVTQQFLSALRGSYGGILMVGLATSLLGMSLVNWYSAGAGVLLGVNALWDDRKNRKVRRRAEAKVAVARLMDDVIFQVSKESRNRLRAVQRALRDHFTEIATESMRTAEDALRAAEEAFGKYGDRRVERIAELDGRLGTLRGVRDRADQLIGV